MNNTSTIALERALKTAVQELRQTLSDENISSLEMEIRASGRTLDGDIEITFKLGGYSQSCEGGQLLPTIAEYIRRYGWNQRHRPLCLPAVAETEAETKA